jgi:hypothetical protein
VKNSMKKNLLLFLAIGMLTYSFVGCKQDAPEDDIVGDWSGTIETRITRYDVIYPGSDTIPCQFSFNTNGTFIQKSSELEYTGTWVSTDVHFGFTYDSDGIPIVFDKLENTKNSQVWTANKDTEVVEVSGGRERTRDASEITTILISR